MIKKLGRPPATTPPMKSRHIRLTDKQWQTFKDKLGPEWLREQIEKAEKTSNTDQ